MKLPAKPPSWIDHHADAVPHLGNVEVQRLVAKTNARSLHWDELRHRPMPPGLKPEHVWALAKLSRLNDRRELPLLHPEGAHFSYRLTSPMLEAMHAVDRWGGSSVDAKAADSLAAIRERVIASSLVEEAIATSQIEGAVTSRRVAKEMLRTGRKARDRSEQMIVNSYETMQLLHLRKDRELSCDLLFEIQTMMTRDTLDDPTAVGRFRAAEDDIAVIDVSDNRVLFMPPDARLVEERMKRLVHFANTTDSDDDDFIHPLVKAAVLHFWLAYEHPFVDGNGRTARALLYWLMLKHGYWLFEFLTISRAIAKSRKAYYRSFLFAEHDDEDLTYSLSFVLDATKSAIEALRLSVEEQQRKEVVRARTLRSLPDLNRRQRALIERATEHPDEVITFQSHEREHRITYLTARADLLELVERGLFEESKQGRQRVFFAAEGLAERLAAPPPSS